MKSALLFPGNSEMMIVWLESPESLPHCLKTLFEHATQPSPVDVDQALFNIKKLDGHEQGSALWSSTPVPARASSSMITMPSPVDLDPASLNTKKLIGFKQASEPKSSTPLQAQVSSNMSVKPSLLAVDPAIVNTKKLVDYELTGSLNSYVEFVSTTSSFLLNVNSYCQESANQSRVDCVSANEVQDSIGIDITPPDYD